MILYDCHCHHASLNGEIVIEQDVHSYGIHPWHITTENIDTLILDFDKKISSNLFITHCNNTYLRSNDDTLIEKSKTSSSEGYSTLSEGYSTSLIEGYSTPSEDYSTSSIEGFSTPSEGYSTPSKSEFFSFPTLFAIGECGLDRCCEAPYELQINAFIHQVKKSEELCLPLIVHCVKAVDDIIRIRKELRAKQPWIFHGFRGKPQQMQQLLSYGFYISFGLHHNAASVKQCPLDHLLLETDDSTISISSLYEKVAQEREESIDSLAQAIETNVNNIFFA